MTEGETYVAELTPPGRGAVAVVVVDGPNATRAVDQLFSTAGDRPLSESPVGRILFGRWGGTGGEEVTAVRLTETEIEIHCHGGLAAIRAVIDRLVAAGCRQIAWQGWIQSREEDPIRVAARVELSAATTARAAAILLDQHQGALRAVLEDTLRLASSSHWPDAAALLDELLSRKGMGLHLTSPWRVVLAGPPNVGKSSLLNALAGFQRAIVSPLPGTTRDVLNFHTAINGWPVQLADTAGLRQSGDELEAAGMKLTKTAVAMADLVVSVRDATISHEEELGATSDSIRKIIVFNKVDLLSTAERERNGRSMAGGDTVVMTSAVTGEGIATLVKAIGHALVPVSTPAGAAVPFTTEHVAAIARARQAANDGSLGEFRESLQPLLSQ
jgi:tRNA modification GTPase